MVYVVTQTPDFGFYPEGAQYLNVPHAAHNTLVTTRGTNIPNESFRYPLSDKLSTIASYNAWCAAIAAAGTGMIRLIWGGRNLKRNPDVYDIEPPPYGKYNIWHTALDDSNLTTFRSYQVSGSPGDGTFPIAYWNNSNAKELLDACDANGIEVIIEFGQNQEFGKEWSRHAWNYDNNYINGNRCEVVDRGFLSDRTQVYTEPDALQAMKDRITFIIDLVGGYKCVCMWGICSEGSYNCTKTFWGVEWGAGLKDIVRNYMVPWYAAIATHIRAEDVYNRPIMSSIARSPTKNGGVWSADPDSYEQVQLEPLVVYPIDIVATNLFQGNYERMIQHVNAVREQIHPKQLLIHQYYPDPWVTGELAPLRVENSPYVLSKRMEWIGMALKWSTGPGRWQGLVEKVHNNWLEGGYADPNWYSIGAVTETFRAEINWKNWSGAEDWADDTASAGLDYSLTTGDGDHFVGLLVWTSGGAKTLTITGVTDGAWTFKIFDWTDGSVDATETPVAAGNSVAVAVTPSTHSQAFVYGEKD